jgi:hypothetical protein
MDHPPGTRGPRSPQGGLPGNLPGGDPGPDPGHPGHRPFQVLVGKGENSGYDLGKKKGRANETLPKRFLISPGRKLSLEIIPCNFNYLIK